MSERVVVIGGGVMGRGIAYVAAVAGMAVRIVDVAGEVLDVALERIEHDLEAGQQRGKIDAAAVASARERITTSTDLEAACSDATLVIEAVIERVDVKQDVLRRAEAASPTDTVIATNTSALSITELFSTLDDASRGVGMHFFNPVPAMRLCELVRGRATSAATLDRAEAAARAMGKETVRVEDVPGFATSRINTLIGNEGLRMLQDGVASAEDIDLAVRLGLNHPMGPLEMGDLVGLDVRLAILEHLAATLGERFEPTAIHRELVDAGRLGRKTGRGVYRYDADGRRVDEPSDLSRTRTA